MSIINEMKSVIHAEAKAMLTLAENLNEEYEQAVELIMESEGKVIIIGIGKSGHIGKKIAASLSSTGTPSFFVHGTEASHGDLGMIENKDIVILISNSGETEEVTNLIPSLKKIGVKMIAITKEKTSSMGRASDIVLKYNYDKEADHLGLAPTTSSTLTLAIGDAMAVTLSKERNFKKEQFHVFHPGGSLGKQLSNNKGVDN